ncbi:unnamed protein product [Scytosiphon promiscuus]
MFCLLKQRIGVSTLLQEFFDDLFQREELPANPYPDLVRRFRIAESAQGLFRSLEDDTKMSTTIENKLARSPELSGVTYVQGSRGVWGMPHILRVTDAAHLEAMSAMLNANEQFLRADIHDVDQHREDCHVNVWVALTGPVSLVGSLIREYWADVQLAVSVEVVTQHFHLAVEIFAETILGEAKGCQGSNRLLLRRVLVDFPLRQKGISGGDRTAWTPRQLNETPDAFIAHIKTSLSFRPSVTMTYLFLSPKGCHKAVGGPIMSVERTYTLHYRSSTKGTTSFTNQPFRSLYDGVFLSGPEAQHYGDVFRTQGLSFATEGVAAAKECLAENVERARGVGDTLSVHASLLPLALLSGVSGDETLARQAVVDVSRVTRSAAARHRSLRHLCDSVIFILELLVRWVQGSEPILKWEDAGTMDHEDLDADDDGDGQWNPKTRCTSPKDLVQTWLRTAHLLFWGWRCDVLRFLDADRHSDVAVIKHKVKIWIDNVSETARMGLKLPPLRWHDHGRTIADGRGVFLNAASTIRRHLSSVSAWLHCLDISLAWDAAKVCDRVHARHVSEGRKSDVAPQGGWPHLLGFQLSGNGGQVRENVLTVPTAVGLLQLQRSWLDDAVAAAYIVGRQAGENKGKRKARRQRKQSAASIAAAIDAAVEDGVRYVPAPAAPDSVRAPKGLDVRQAVVKTLSEDVVPEASAHEITLIKYASDKRVDQSLHDSVSKVLSSILTPNPFPVLTNDVAKSSMSHVLRQGVDSENATKQFILKLVSGDEDKNSQVFMAGGSRKGANIYGARSALTDVNVDVVLSLFDSLPPVEVWLLDEPGSSCEAVNVGIFGSAQHHRSSSHHDVPSNLTVMLACACRFDLQSGATPVESFARSVVRCATSAHKESGLLVIDLEARVNSDQFTADSGDANPCAGGERFSLQQVLTEPGRVEEELARLHPQELVLEALMSYPTSTRGETLVPVSMRFFLAAETEDDVRAGCSVAVVAEMFSNCVFPTASGAESASARYTALTQEFDLEKRHVKRMRALALEMVDGREYLEAYRLVYHLRCLRSAAPHDEVSVPQTSQTETNPSHEDDDAIPLRKAWKVPPPISAKKASSDEAVATAIRRMLRGPAGRLDHARLSLQVLRRIVQRESFSPAMLALLEERAIIEHAEYCTSYLLDTLAEQPLVRFEGAIESIKLRARLLLDRVREMVVGGISGPREASARAVGADATRETACCLAAALVSMLEVVQLAAELDTHRCCPEMDEVLEQFRAIANRKDSNLAHMPEKDKRRSAETAGGGLKRAGGIANSKKAGGVRFRRRNSKDRRDDTAR